MGETNKQKALATNHRKIPSCAKKANTRHTVINTYCKYKNDHEKCSVMKFFLM